MTEKVNQRVAITKRLLKESMIQILQKKNIRQVTVSELCSRAGINRSTFYAHYSIPSDVLMEIKKDFVFSMAESLRYPDQDSSVYEKLRIICQYIYDNRQLQKIILSNSSDDEVLEAALETSFDIWGPVKDTEYIRKLDRDSDLLARSFYYYGFFRVLREWIIRDIHKTPEEVADILYSILTGHIYNISDRQKKSL